MQFLIRIQLFLCLLSTVAYCQNVQNKYDSTLLFTYPYKVDNTITKRLIRTIRTRRPQNAARNFPITTIENRLGNLTVNDSLVTVTRKKFFTIKDLVSSIESNSFKNISLTTLRQENKTKLVNTTTRPKDIPITIIKSLFTDNTTIETSIRNQQNSYFINTSIVNSQSNLTTDKTTPFDNFTLPTTVSNKSKALLSNFFNLSSSTTQRYFENKTKLSTLQSTSSSSHIYNSLTTKLNATSLLELANNSTNFTSLTSLFYENKSSSTPNSYTKNMESTTFNHSPSNISNGSTLPFERTNLSTTFQSKLISEKFLINITSSYKKSTTDTAKMTAVSSTTSLTTSSSKLKFSNQTISLPSITQSFNVKNTTVKLQSLTSSKELVNKTELLNSFTFNTEDNKTLNQTYVTNTSPPTTQKYSINETNISSSTLSSLGSSQSTDYNSLSPSTFKNSTAFANQSSPITLTLVKTETRTKSSSQPSTVTTSPSSFEASKSHNIMTHVTLEINVTSEPKTSISKFLFSFNSTSTNNTKLILTTNNATVSSSTSTLTSTSSSIKPILTYSTQIFNSTVSRVIASTFYSQNKDATTKFNEKLDNQNKDATTKYNEKLDNQNNTINLINDTKKNSPFETTIVTRKPNDFSNTNISQAKLGIITTSNYVISSKTSTPADDLMTSFPLDKNNSTFKNTIQNNINLTSTPKNMQSSFSVTKMTTLTQDLNITSLGTTKVNNSLYIPQFIIFNHTLTRGQQYVTEIKTTSSKLLNELPTSSKQNVTLKTISYLDFKNLTFFKENKPSFEITTKTTTSATRPPNITSKIELSVKDQNSQRFIDKNITKPIFEAITTKYFLNISTESQSKVHVLTTGIRKDDMNSTKILKFGDTTTGISNQKPKNEFNVTKQFIQIETIKNISKEANGTTKIIPNILTQNVTSVATSKVDSTKSTLLSSEITTNRSNSLFNPTPKAHLNENIQISQFMNNTSKFPYNRTTMKIILDLIKTSVSGLLNSDTTKSPLVRFDDPKQNQFFTIENNLTLIPKKTEIKTEVTTPKNIQTTVSTATTSSTSSTTTIQSTTETKQNDSTFEISKKRINETKAELITKMGSQDQTRSIKAENLEIIKIDDKYPALLPFSNLNFINLIYKNNFIFLNFR
jgi:hypothetical protein